MLTIVIPMGDVLPLPFRKIDSEVSPECVVCHHDVVIVDTHGEIVMESKLPDNLKRDFSTHELVNGAWLLTLTMCFRNVLTDFPNEFLRVFNGDNFLTSLLGNHGISKYLGDSIVPDVYRVHSGGLCSQLPDCEVMLKQANTYYWLSRYHKRVEKLENAQLCLKSHRKILQRVIRESLRNRAPRYVLRACGDFGSRRENLLLLLDLPRQITVGAYHMLRRLGGRVRRIWRRSPKPHFTIRGRI